MQGDPQRVERRRPSRFLSVGRHQLPVSVMPPQPLRVPALPPSLPPSSGRPLRAGHDAGCNSWRRLPSNCLWPMHRRSAGDWRGVMGGQGSPRFAPKKHHEAEEPVRCSLEPPTRAGCVQVDLKLRVEKLNVTMVPGVTGAGEGPGPRLPHESKEDREERVLAMLGIVGTILNLLVIIFVYIYTTI